MSRYVECDRCKKRQTMSEDFDWDEGTYLPDKWVTKKIDDIDYDLCESCISIYAQEEAKFIKGFIKSSLVSDIKDEKKS